MIAPGPGARVIVAHGGSRYLAAVKRTVPLLLVLALAAACLWRSYDEILAVHLTVLMQMADKMSAFAQAGHAPSAAEMAEFNYPAQRGRAFLRSFERYADRSSYRRFADFLGRYEAVVKRVDELRSRAVDWPKQQDWLEEEKRALAAVVEEIRREPAR